MTLLIISFIAGLLTVLAPCVLPLLPVILGGAVAEAGNRRRPFVIIAALSVSVFAFTLILKGSTALITVSPSFWSYVSAVIFIAFGLTLLFPDAWARLILKIPGHNKPDSWMSKGYMHRGSLWADILVGAALGPVFTTCSPTFFVILATVLPQSISMGVIDLAAYIVGLAISLLLIAFIGQKLVNRLEWAADPKGWFKRLLGALFIILAVAIVFGWDKQIEASILRSGFFDVTNIEQSIHQSLDGLKTGPADSGALAESGPRYVEIAKPAGFVNSTPFKLADLVGKKVILIDFVDYTCINCERTFPYLNDWYSNYKDQGLEIVAIHTPEFSFEKDIANVSAAAKQFGLTFPIVLDNDYATWNAYANQYWPHKYLIDIHGNVVFDHIGEGGYDETEKQIVAALNERKQVLGEAGTVSVGTSTMPMYSIQTQSPETYFGASRNQGFGNGPSFTKTDATFAVPDSLEPNRFYLGGSWDIQDEYALENGSGYGDDRGAQLSFVFSASKMYIVAAKADGQPVQASVLIDGKPISAAQSGADVKDGVLTITASRLYHIFSSTDGRASPHRIDIIFKKPGVEAFTFTFG